LRTFIAIELPNQIQDQIHIQQQSLAQVLNDPPIRWVKSESIHLTLKFLGEISPEKAQEIGEGLPAEAGKFPAARVRIGGIGCFPNFSRPRVLWVGLEDPSATLKDLQGHLDLWLEGLGFEPEKRGFSPHLTIGRVHRRVNNRQRKQIGEHIRNFTVPPLGEFTAYSVHLFKSDLKPTGAIYTRLATARLGETDE
jgi:2'-5' RNA ligase